MATMAAALIVASGVALAAAVQCPNQSNGACVGTEQDDDITGTNNTDVIFALGGNDSVQDLGGNDLVDAGAGNDGVAGGDGADFISCGPGTDTVINFDQNLDVVASDCENVPATATASEQAQLQTIEAQAERTKQQVEKKAEQRAGSPKK